MELMITSKLNFWEKLQEGVKGVKVSEAAELTTGTEGVEMEKKLFH